MDIKYLGIILLSIIFILSILSQIYFPKNNKCTTITAAPLRSPTLGIFTKSQIDNFKAEYKKNQIVYIEDIFSNDYFKKLKAAVDSQLKNTENKRTGEFLNSFRKAGIISSKGISQKDIIELYYNDILLKFINIITGINLEHVSCNDKASYNILVYDKPDDYINWHFDVNQYTGKRLTILLSIYNHNEFQSDLSSSTLQYNLPLSPEIKSLKMKENSILIFNGSEILHRATSIKKNEKRIIISNTYCDICQETLFGRLYRVFADFVLNY